MLNNRVIIPESFRDHLLNELHDGYLGISKMKGVTRSCIWWPNMDSVIVQVRKACESCASQSRDPAKASLHNWFEARPFERIRCRQFLYISRSTCHRVDYISKINNTSENNVFFGMESLHT